jgi:dienelactone hydrolase
MKSFEKTALTFTLFAVFMLIFVGCEQSSNSADDGRATGAVNANIEATYSAAGPFSVAVTSVTGYQIFHPGKMAGNHPIITWGNGTGAPTISYNALLRHLASWGFVVVASNSTMTQNGQEMIGGVDYLIAENKKSGSKFYNMLDTESIGTTGHSQGGGGAINAATDPRVKCTAPMAPSPGQIQEVKCPTFLVAGSADTLVSASLVRSMNYARAKAPTIFGIIQGADHMIYVGNGGQARGYVTAWFMYHLQGDQAAQQAFEEGGELFKNSNWEVEKKNY